MRWPFKKRFIPHPCFAVGAYRINTSIDGLPGLSPASLDTLTALDLDLTFKGEQVWHAPQAEFMDLQWETMLGTVNNEIYKVSIQYTGPSDKAGRAYGRLLPFLTRLYGNSKSMTAWDASDGNVVMLCGNIGPESIISIAITSARIRQFGLA